MIPKTITYILYKVLKSSARFSQQLNFLPIVTLIRTNIIPKLPLEDLSHNRQEKPWRKIIVKRFLCKWSGWLYFYLITSMDKPGSLNQMDINYLFLITNFVSCDSWIEQAFSCFVITITQDVTNRQRNRQFGVFFSSE